MTTPTKAECWDRFWDVIALALVDVARQEAAEAARTTTE